MSTHVVGFRPPDKKWHQMKAVWDACRDAEIFPPAEVSDYFQGEDPDPAGVEVSLTHPNHASVRVWSDDYRSGYEVLLDQLPPDINILRFYNSW